MRALCMIRGPVAKAFWPCRFRCPIETCHQPYSMQPVDHQERKETNPNPKWEVPFELIEWQCSYTQKGAEGLSGGAWSEDWQFTDSTKCVHLLKRLYEIGVGGSQGMAAKTYAQKVCLQHSS